MITSGEELFISLCLEWFLYGKILISALTLVPLLKKSNYSLGQASIPEYSRYIYNAQRKIPGQQ